MNGKYDGTGQRQYLYRIDGCRDVKMTPASAAWYAERYNADVRPVGAAPLAPEGKLEAGHDLQMEGR